MDAFHRSMHSFFFLDQRFNAIKTDTEVTRVYVNNTLLKNKNANR